MRDWMDNEKALAESGAVLIYLTTDSPETIAAAKEANQLRGDIRSVDPKLWEQWGLAVGRRPELPHPTTLVVDPAGRLVFKETHKNYTQRVAPQRLLADWTELGLDSASEATPTMPDWDAATQLAVRSTADSVTLTLTVQPGFHVYGHREEIGRPLALRVDDHPELSVAIPPGQEKSLSGLGSAWVLTDQVELTVPVTPPASGELDLQICTETSCSMPRVVKWATDP